MFRGQNYTTEPWPTLSESLFARSANGTDSASDGLPNQICDLQKTGEPYQEQSAAEYAQKQRERELKHLQRRAQKLGDTLAPVPASGPESTPEPGSEGSF